MLRQTAGNIPRFTRCPEPHGSLGPGFRARRSRFTPRLSHIMRSTGCAAPERGSAERGPDPRCSRGAARRSPQPPAGAARAPPLPLVPRKGKGAEQGWLLPRSAGLAPRSPPHNLPRLAGKARVAVPRRALTYTDGVGEPRQCLPQQPRQQQQEGPGRALPHLLQPLRFSP